MPAAQAHSPAAQRQRVRRSVWLLVALVLTVYAGFIVLSVMRARA